MKQLFHAEDRRLLASMAALSLVTVLAAVTISLAMAAYVNQAVKDTYAGIVGTVVQRYPQAEVQVVQDLRSPGVDSVNLGTQVLEKYGLGDQSAADTGVAAGLLARLLPVGLALLGLVCTGFVLSKAPLPGQIPPAGSGAFGVLAPHRRRRLCAGPTR